MIVAHASQTSIAMIVAHDSPRQTSIASVLHWQAHKGRAEGHC